VARLVGGYADSRGRRHVINGLAEADNVFLRVKVVRKLTFRGDYLNVVKSRAVKDTSCGVTSRKTSVGGST
jgi:hypothetical protein